jgi:hypothetical protein
MELEVCKRNGHRFQPWAPRSLPSRRGSRSMSGFVRRRAKLELDVLTDRHLRGAEAFRRAFLLPCELKQLYAAFGNTLGKFHNGPDFRLPMPARYVVDQDGRIRAAESSGEIKPAMNDEGSADTAAANPFVCPDVTRECHEELPILTRVLDCRGRLPDSGRGRVEHAWTLSRSLSRST